MEAVASDRDPGGSSFRQLPLEVFFERLASDDPVPGGGTAAAMAGSMAAALVSMVAVLSRNRPRYEPFAPTIERAHRVATEARSALLDLADADAEAYARVVTARRLPHTSDDERVRRAAAIAAAMRSAVEAPLETGRWCEAVAVEADALAGRSNLNAASDLDVAAMLLEAGARAAAANVVVNVRDLDDEGYAGGVTAEINGHVRAIQQLVRQIHETVAENRLRDPEPT